MKKTISVLNDMLADRVVENYAIGGAMAALFYAEPVVTYDLDVFVLLPAQEGSLVRLDKIYGYLKGRSYKVDKEHVLIEGIPVQFLPAYNALTEDAVREAAQLKFEGEPVRVARLEHLLAIMAQTGRAKDKARIEQLLDECKVDRKALTRILTRHTLLGAWKKILHELGEREA